MSITDKKGINVTSGFKLISPQPIDARMVVEDENELVSIVDSAAAYEGQLVYVKSLDKYVSFDGSQFNELETGGGASAHVEGDALVINNSGGTGSGTGSGGGGGSGLTKHTITLATITTALESNIITISDEVLAELSTFINSNPVFYNVKLSVSASAINLFSATNCGSLATIGSMNGGIELIWYLPQYGHSSSSETDIPTTMFLSGSHMHVSTSQSVNSIYLSDSDMEVINAYIPIGAIIEYVLDYYTM